MKVLLARPRGFCAGVNMAIQALEEAIRLFGEEVYVYHEIVHNKHVVQEFAKRGVRFVDDIRQVPHGSVLLFSAHGVSPAVREEARRRNLRTIDATCPLVTKVHVEALRFARAGYKIVLIGHAGHDEVVGTLGEAPEHIWLVGSVEEVDRLPFGPDEKVAYLTQTTLSVMEANTIIERLRQRFPGLVGPSKEDICYATTNRQRAVTQLAPQADLVIVLGSQNSSNSQRLRELAERCGKPAYLVDSIRQVPEHALEQCETVLVTAGASAPEVLVRECVEHLQENYGATVEEVGASEEDVRFSLPVELRRLRADRSA